jgi:hypothetical protein
VSEYKGIKVSKVMGKKRKNGKWCSLLPLRAYHYHFFYFKSKLFTVLAHFRDSPIHLLSLPDNIYTLCWLWSCQSSTINIKIKFMYETRKSVAETKDPFLGSENYERVELQFSFFIMKKKVKSESIIIMR